MIVRGIFLVVIVTFFFLTLINIVVFSAGRYAVGTATCTPYTNSGENCRAVGCSGGTFQLPCYTTATSNDEVDPATNSKNMCEHINTGCTLAPGGGIACTNGNKQVEYGVNCGSTPWAYATGLIHLPTILYV